jgi:phosphatidylglycerophosphatase A
MPSTRPIKLALATGLGTGLLPMAPGTWASAAVGAVYVLAAWASGDSPVLVNGLLAAVALAATAGCVALGPFVEQAFGRKDPGACTLDEWAGQAVALLALPAGGTWAGRLAIVATAFLAFRAFDILKPPPVRQCERWPAGWGIAADDLVAGVYANLAAQLLLRLWLLKALAAGS